MNHIIFTFTRKQAVEDGEMVDVSTTAREAGIKFPVFLTRTVFNKYVAVPEGVNGQDENGRLWDICWMLRYAIKCNPNNPDRIPVPLYVRNDNRSPKRVTLVAVCDALDFDDPQPAITIMLPYED